MEIERKWLLAAVPEIDRAIEHAKVEQFYVSINPEVRLRRYIAGGDNKIPFRLTIKGEGTLIREEIQTPVTEEFYLETKRFVAKPAIIKDLYVHQINGYEICTSIVDPESSSRFIYCEVEFNSVNEALAYELPWPELVVREVTGEKPFKMKNYWMQTRF